MINPDFFIIGAQKAGTTSLYKLLESTDLVSLPYNKETHFFSFDNIYKKKYKWYVSQFSINYNKKIFGEVDPSYLYINKSAERIKKINKNPKFIIILRKPIDRSYSHYLMSRNKGYEKLSFLDAIKHEKSRLESSDFSNKINFSYLDRSNYCNQILFYKNVFPDSKFLFLNFDDLSKTKESKKLYIQIFEFLKLKINSSDNFYHENKSYKPRFVLFNKLLFNNKMFAFIANILVPNNSFRLKIKAFLTKLNNSSETEDELNIDALPESVVNWNNNEVKKLQNITKLNLSDWMI